MSERKSSIRMLVPWFSAATSDRTAAQRGVAQDKSLPVGPYPPPRCFEESCTNSGESGKFCVAEAVDGSHPAPAKNAAKAG
jgi:hypothetical protein